MVRRHRAAHICRLLFSLTLLVAGFSPHIKADQGLIEHKVKAAYLYHFTKFVDWSATKRPVGSFNICIIGHDPFGKLLHPIENKISAGMPIKLFRYNRILYESDCHIIYIHSPGYNWRKNFQPISNEGILTVSASKDFARKGGMIGFVIKDKKVRLQINLSALKRAGLTISAKLLEVAEVLNGGKG